MAKCEICKVGLDVSECYKIDRQKVICQECAETEAVKAQKENMEIEITDYDGFCGYAICTYCGTFHKISEMRTEFQKGKICKFCLEWRLSHGETITIHK